jgi:hypothetical protein
MEKGRRKIKIIAHEECRIKNDLDGKVQIPR